MNYTQHNYAQSELDYKEFIKPSVEKAIQRLNITNNFQILDAGCGPGVTIHHLLKATNFTGHIHALDASQPHLDVAKQLVREHNIENKVTLLQGDLFMPLPFTENYFDVIWLSDVFFPDDTGNETATIIFNLKKFLKPGGTLAIFYGNWLRLQLLSGYSELEHAISIANELRKSAEQKWEYELHPENALEWLMNGNFQNCDVSFHNTIYKSPLDNNIKKYICWHLKNIYDKAVHFQNDTFSIDKDLIDLWDKISGENAPDFILNRANYYCAAFGLLTIGTK